MRKNISKRYKQRLQKLSGIPLNENVEEGIVSKNNRERANNLYRSAISAGKNISSATKDEGKETAEMLKTFNLVIRQRLNLDKRKDPPTEQELKDAIAQLKDVPKLAVFASIFGGISWFIPGSTTAYLIIAIGLYNSTKGKVNLIPSSFEEMLKGEGDKLSVKKLLKRKE